MDTISSTISISYWHYWLFDICSLSRPLILNCYQINILEILIPVRVRKILVSACKATSLV